MMETNVINLIKCEQVSENIKTTLLRSYYILTDKSYSSCKGWLSTFIDDAFVPERILLVANNLTGKMSRYTAAISLTSYPTEKFYIFGELFR